MTRVVLRSYELAQQKFVDAFAQLDADINNPMLVLLEDDDDEGYKLNAFLDEDELQEERLQKAQRRTRRLLSPNHRSWI